MAELLVLCEYFRKQTDNATYIYMYCHACRHVHYVHVLYSLSKPYLKSVFQIERGTGARGPQLSGLAPYFTKLGPRRAPLIHPKLCHSPFSGPLLLVRAPYFWSGPPTFTSWGPCWPPKILHEFQTLLICNKEPVRNRLEQI